MPRVIWKGAVSFGLVHIPVALYPATCSDDLDFDWLDRRTMDRVGYQRINKTTSEEVPREQIVRGYAYERNRYVSLTDEDIRAANPVSTQTVDLPTSVDAAEIPFLYLDTPPFSNPPTGADARDVRWVRPEVWPRSPSRNGHAKASRGRLYSKVCATTNPRAAACAKLPSQRVQLARPARRIAP